jgi:hypothetical protein
MELHPAQDVLETRTGGFRAPGPIVMVLQEGTGWVLRQDGSRETVEGPSVVIFDTGDWFEYGTNSNSGVKIDSYWETDLSEEEWKAIFARAGLDIT